MTARPSLADRIAAALAAHGPMSGAALARLLHVRKLTVQRELRDAARFELVGRGRSSVWNRRGTEWEPHPRHPAAEGDLDTVRAQIAELGARIASLEYRVRSPGPDGPIPGQLIAATNGSTT